MCLQGHHSARCCDSSVRPRPAPTLVLRGCGRPRSREDRRAATGPSFPKDAEASAQRASPAQLPGPATLAPEPEGPRSCLRAGGSGGPGLPSAASKGLREAQGAANSGPREIPSARALVGASGAQSPATTASRCRCCLSGRTGAPSNCPVPTSKGLPSKQQLETCVIPAPAFCLRERVNLLPSSPKWLRRCSGKRTSCRFAGLLLPSLVGPGHVSLSSWVSQALPACQALPWELLGCTDDGA